MAVGQLPIATMREKRTIGRVDIIDFPEFALYNIEAKVDTGAYTSAIHCSKVKLITEEDVQKISFHIPGSRKHGLGKRRFVTEHFREKHIKNSFGQTEKRFVIRTKILLFGKLIHTEFSLSDRTKMRYPILLGRKMLKNRFIVDVSCSYLSYSRKQEKKLSKLDKPID